MNSDEIKQIIDTLVPKLKPAFLTLFGSQASGTQSAASDVDIAFYTQETSPSVYDTFIIAQELASVLNKEVDLIRKGH